MAILGFLSGLDLCLSAIVSFGCLEVFESFLVILQFLGAILKHFGVIGEQPLPLAHVHGLLHVVKEFFGCSSMPDARLERCTIIQFDLLGTRFFQVCVECNLYLVDDQYISNGGALCVYSLLSLLILEPLKYPILLSHFLEVTGKRGTSKEQFLGKTFHWSSHELFLGR
jgi:hypothetical protein